MTAFNLAPRRRFATLPVPQHLVAFIAPCGAGKAIAQHTERGEYILAIDDELS